jgi:hypothetical protein
MGCLLVKPDMGHIRTEPNIFVPGETYVPVRWDFSDLPEVCARYLADNVARKAITARAYQVLVDYYRSHNALQRFERNPHPGRSTESGKARQRLRNKRRSIVYDYLVVGCGLFGSVFAQQAKENGKSVMMIDRRPHIGGNCYSYDYEDTNISVHKYGSHIFHCADDDTWNYINRFTEFNRYRHRVLTTRQGKVYSMPINLGTINSFFGTNLKPDDVPSFLDTQRTFTDRPANLEEHRPSVSSASRCTKPS